MRKTRETMEEEYKDLGENAPQDVERLLEQYASIGSDDVPCQMSVINGDPTKDYYWAARTVYNEEIPGWEHALVRDHWVPAKASDLPEMAALVSSGAFKGSNTGYITYQGSILYCRDKRFGLIDEQRKLKAERELRRSMNYMSADFDVRYQSKVDKNITTTSRGPEY